MKRHVADVAALKRMALASGAEVVLGGQHFNAGRETVAAAAAPAPAAPVPPAPAPAPAAAQAPALTHEDVERMLVANDRMWEERLRRATAEMRRAVAGAVPAPIAAPAPAPARAVEWVATSEYDSYGRHLRTRLVPVYESRS